MSNEAGDDAEALTDTLARALDEHDERRGQYVEANDGNRVSQLLSRLTDAIERVLFFQQATESARIPVERSGGNGGHELIDVLPIGIVIALRSVIFPENNGGHAS